jgi:type II secretory pathway component PulF
VKFTYTGYDAGGRALSGTIEASDANDASEQLRRKGIFASGVKSEGEGAPIASVGARPRGRRHVREVAVFVRELSVLVGSGTPMVDALGSLERQAPAGPWRNVLGDVRKRVEEGEQLSEAIARHPACFDAVARSLIQAGEQGGKLDVLLNRLALLTRQQMKIRSSVRGAMVYPCLLITVAMSVLTAMVGFVMPRFEGLFKSLQAPLPPTTKVLMGVGAFAREHWIMLLAGLVGSVAGVVFWQGTAGGKRSRDVLLVRLPQIGKATRSFATARIARVLGVLMDGKVPLLEALRLVRESTSNTLYVDLVTRAEDAVTKGDSLSVALSNPTLISPSVCEAIRNAERTGRLAGVLSSVADHMDEDNEIVLRTLTGLIEPVILIVMGVLVGGVAISMFMPLFDLTAAGSPGGGG